MPKKEWYESATPGKQLWRCDGCGKIDKWGESWGWYGSGLDLDAGRQSYAVSCSPACQEKARRWYDTLYHPKRIRRN